MPVRLSGPRWRNWPVRQACIVKEVLSSVLPAVSGQVDELIQQLEVYLKHYTTTRPETERRTAGRHKAILRSGGRTDVAEEDTPYQHVRNREAKEDLVKLARTWGEKTAKALEYHLLEGKTQKESAELANIPYQPFRRKMVKLRKHMSELYR
jgi:DNA-directed RNA polymerase specialized sigma24 family protein